jgi:hypothetical protein
MHGTFEDEMALDSAKGLRRRASALIFLFAAAIALAWLVSPELVAAERDRVTALMHIAPEAQHGHFDVDADPTRETGAPQLALR